MIIFACVDDGMGMMFNRRRQSSDRILRLRIRSIAAGHALWMNSYSAEMFDGADSIKVSENPLDDAVEHDFCFVENEDLTAHADKINIIYLYRWNRAYPSDFRFEIDLSEYDLKSTSDFAGSSHEKITEDIYIRKEL